MCKQTNQIGKVLEILQGFTSIDRCIKLNFYFSKKAKLVTIVTIILYQNERVWIKKKFLSVSDSYVSLRR